MSDFETMPVGTRKALRDAATLLNELSLAALPELADRTDAHSMARRLEHLLAEVPHG